MSLNPRFVLECDKFCPVEPLPLSHQVADGDSQDKGIVRLKNSERPNTKPAVRKNRQFATGRGERKGPSFSKKPTDKSAIKLSNFRLNFTVPEQAEECAKAGSAVHLVGSAFFARVPVPFAADLWTGVFSEVAIFIFFTELRLTGLRGESPAPRS